MSESDYLGHNKQTSPEGFKEDGSQLSHLFKCLKRFSQRECNEAPSVSPGAGRVRGTQLRKPPRPGPLGAGVGSGGGADRGSSNRKQEKWSPDRLEGN